MVKADKRATYTYDSSGRRVSKTVGGVTTYYLWDGDLLMAEENASGVVTHSYTWGPAGLISDRVGGVTRFYLYDAQGNTRLLMDASGIVLGRATYSAWGSVIYSTLPANCPFGWQGAEGAYTDPETGLVYLHNRYYAPAIGRFLTRDPSGFAGGINLYAYCSGDPIDRHDPAGLAGNGNFGPYMGGGPAMPTNSDDTAPGDDIIPPGTNTASDIMFHPGQKAGSDRSNMANQMLGGLEITIGTAAFGAAGGAFGMVGDGAIASADAAEASSGGIRVVLGRNKDQMNGALERFKDFLDGKMYTQWQDYSKSFEDNFMNVVGNENNEVHFNLQGINNPNAWADAGRNGLDGENYTSWELHTIRTNPQWWGRTTWWNKIDGVFTQVANPFAP